MSEPDSPQPPPSNLRALMAIPILFAAIALGGALVMMRRMGGEHAASGERLAVRMVGPCASEARDVVYRRADQIGLGEPVLDLAGEALTLTATMPGLPDDRTAIPALLSRRGAWTISSADGDLASEDDVAKASVNLDPSGAPYAEVQLSAPAAARVTEALRAGKAVDVSLDGVRVVHQEGGDLEGDKLTLTPDDGEPRARMRQAADWAILLSAGAIPCELRVESVAPAPGAG